MKHLTKALSLSTVMFMAFVLVVSCSQDTLQPKFDPVVSEETKAKFVELGFDVSDIEKVPAKNPLLEEKEQTDGFSYLLEGDIHISPEDLESMLQSDIAHEGPVGEQYRTWNLVSKPRTIRVIGYTGGSLALTSKMRTALSWAIANYNAINLDLNFTLAYGTNWWNYDIVVYKPSGGAGGSAGFPSGGDPYQFVQIFSGTDAYSTNVNEHVITHEIGHCLGLRHTDYFNRSLSCGSGGNEGSAGVGAVHIPGTPTGFDANSVMLACFNSGESGEFGSYDVVALQYLY